MTTIIVAPSERQINAEAFAGLTDAAAAVSVEGSAFRVEFDADLPAEKVAEIRDFMASRDDVAMAARANLAALRDAAVAADLSTTEGLTALRDMNVAAINYLLDGAI